MLRSVILQKKSLFLPSSLKEMWYEGLDIKTVLFFSNNQAAIKLANNPNNYL